MIYFAQAVEGGPIKIGYSDNLKVRHHQLEAYYGTSLAILATMPGGPEIEAEIHERFAHLRFDRKTRRGRQPEQFRPAPDLMAFIGQPVMVGMNPDAIEAMGGHRISVYNLKGSPEYRDWLNGLSAASLITTSAIIRDALAKWAKERGCPPPPEL
jgi:Meiotically Up-regulated Gene 113 (MUG113) protein